MKLYKFSKKCKFCYFHPNCSIRKKKSAILVGFFYTCVEILQTKQLLTNVKTFTIVVNDFGDL